MNILYVSQYFSPEKCAPAARVSELAQHWADNGHGVTVLTGFPNHPTGVIDPEYRKRFRRLFCREQSGGVWIVRTWLWPMANAKVWKRLICYVSFCLSACVAGIFLKHPHVVIATSPQLLVGLSGWFLATCFGVPFVLEIRDLWPESLCAVGARARKSPLYRAVGSLARFLYKHCDHVVVVTPAFREKLIAQWQVPPEKIDVVENGVETTVFSPGDSTTDLRKALALEGKFIVSYIGTIGMAHGLETVLDAAQLVGEKCPSARVLLVGDGAERAHVEREIALRGLKNVSVLPAQRRETVPVFIRASDVCLVHLKKDPVFETVIPTKMLEFMSCGRPVILGVEGQAAEILQRAQAGICIRPGDAEQMAEAISMLYGDNEVRERLGANGRAYILRHLTRARTAGRYLTVLESVRDEAQRKHPLGWKPAAATDADTTSNAAAFATMKSA